LKSTLPQRLNGLRENSWWAQSAATGAEALPDFMALRGAEAPLFHGTARIRQFFHSL
jgi:hypothetical protein